MNRAIVIQHIGKKFIPYRSGRRLPAKKNQDYITACDDINFEVSQGELVGLIGSNGSGKTTLLRILSTAYLPDSGDALINGFSLKKEEQKVKDSINFLSSENTNFYGRLTGRQNLDFFAAFGGIPVQEAQAKIRYWADWFKITEYLDNIFQSYSSGIRQRCHLLRWMLFDKPVLLLDEPTKNLDPAIAKKFLVYLKEELVVKQAKAAIMTSHSLEEVSQVADQIAVIQCGQLKIFEQAAQLKIKMGAGNTLQGFLEPLYRGADS